MKEKKCYFKTAFLLKESFQKLTSLSQKLFETSPKLDLIQTSCVICSSSDSSKVAEGYDYEYGTASNFFSFCECAQCGHLYLNPRPDEKDLSIIYPSNYYAFTEKGTGTSIVGFFRKIWESAKIKSFKKLIGFGSKKILDIGCGEGRLLSLFKEYGDSNWELIGLDLDPEAANRCRERGFRCEIGRVEDFQGKETFDVMIMFQLIEHVDNPRRVLESMRKMLNPGGFLILETPNPKGIDYHLFKKSWWGHYHFPRHWHLFKTEILTRILKECGYVDVRYSPLLSPASWIISIHNYLLAKNYPAPLIRFFDFRNPLLLSFFVACELLQKLFLGQTSNQRMTARVPF